ncbi:MAG: tyrosine-type recombinase/integrase [Oscillatoriales cyanobacterium C42_A2020_001]|nr:tyrosine-type recombinase/integrase [Leptolyngbyaceae cyanobacterium C42_A2020_001]
MPKKRAKRGSVQVGECHDSLRLLWTYQGKRYVLALGLRNIPYHQKLANDRALWLTREIQYGRFHPEKLDQYRDFLRGEKASLLELPTVKAPPLSQLWQQYLEVRNLGKSPSTIRQYNWVTRHIARLPTDDLRQVQAILDAIAKLSPDVQKRLLTQFCACAKWAQKSGLLTDNPFLGAAAAVKLPQRGTVEDEIHPFSRAERDQIIQAFRNDRHYQHYANLVAFLFFTGCRPCEVLPLQWKQIKACYILFDKDRVDTGKGYQTKQGLKTQKWRRFPINEQLRFILADMERGDDESLVFPSVKGTYIQWNNFTNRAWKSVLSKLPEIEYCNPYQMRHSFVSHCRSLNVPSIQVAEWIGNSVEMVDRVYAQVTESHSVPLL